MLSRVRTEGHHVFRARVFRSLRQAKAARGSLANGQNLTKSQVDVKSGVRAGKGSVHERAEALRFLQICLASALNLRSPADSALPGTAADKLAAMLFGGQVGPCVLGICARPLTVWREPKIY